MPGPDVTMAPTATHAVRRALAQARGWGWPGAVGLVGVIAALIAATIWLPALQRQSDAFAADTDAAELRAARLESQRRVKVPAALAPQRFRDGFPSARARQERLAALLTLAAQHGLEPRRAEFRLTQDADLGLLRYSVNMPLAGPYAQLRAFIEEAQARDPALGLDRARMRRASPNAATVEAELGWTLYMQTDVPATAPSKTFQSASR